MLTLFVKLWAGRKREQDSFFSVNILKITFWCEITLVSFCCLFCHFRRKKNAGWFGQSHEEFWIQSWIHWRFAENQWCKIYFTGPMGHFRKVVQRVQLYRRDASPLACFVRHKGQKMGTCFGQGWCASQRDTPLKGQNCTFKKNRTRIYKLEINQFTLHHVTNSPWSFFQFVRRMSKPV